jgi:predicted PurR-regulated permease PerM
MTEITLKSKNHGWLWILLLIGLIYVLYLLHGILMPFIAGLLVAYLLNPLVHRLEKYHLQRTVSTSLLIFAFFIGLGSSVFVAIPFLKRELLKLAHRIPVYINSIIAFIDPYLMYLQGIIKAKDFKNLDTTLSSYFGDMASWVLTFIAGLFSNTLALANLISLIILTPVISFYFLRDWPRLMAVLDNLLPREHAPKIRKLFMQINDRLGGYFRGQALVCLCLALYYMVGLSVVGLDFSLTIGLITGVFAFIPYFGYLIGVSAGVGVAIGQFSDWLSVWMVVSVFAGGQVLETYYLLPKLVGDRTGLHPIWIIFSLLAGGFLFGFMGILFAMPVAAMCGVLVRFAVQEYRHSSFYLQRSGSVRKVTKN